MNKRVIFISLTIILIIIGSSIVFIYNSFSSEEKHQIENLNEDINQLELVFWRNNGTKSENDAYKELISTFESTNPSIDIKMVLIPYGDYELRLRTEIAAGNPPDIMAMDSPNLAVYANSGSLISIDKYMRSEGNIDDIPSTTLAGLTFEDEIYLSPVVESGVGLMYNMHLFKEAGIPYPSKDPTKPLTWDEVLEISKQITDHTEGIYGIDPAQGFSDGESAAYFKLPLLWQFGAEVLSPDFTTAEGYLNSNQALKALQFYQNLYHKHKVASVELPPNPFESGKLGMTVIGSWSLAEFEKNNPDFILGEDFGIAPLPKGVKQVAPNGGWALGISSKSEYPEEAWEFIKYVTSHEGSKKYVELTGDLPARYSVAKEFPNLNEYPRNIFVKQTQNFSKNRPVTAAYPIISDTIRELFEDVGIGGINVEAAATEAVQRINNGLNEIQK